MWKIKEIQNFTQTVDLPAASLKDLSRTNTMMSGNLDDYCLSVCCYRFFFCKGSCGCFLNKAGCDKIEALSPSARECTALHVYCKRGSWQSDFSPNVQGTIFLQSTSSSFQSMVAVIVSDPAHLEVLRSVTVTRWSGKWWHDMLSLLGPGTCTHLQSWAASYSSSK